MTASAIWQAFSAVFSYYQGHHVYGYVVFYP